MSCKSRTADSPEGRMTCRIERPDRMVIFMATAYVLIKTRPGHERDVYYSLARRRRFAELHPVTGQYNLVAKVTSDSMESIGYIVLEEFNNTENVRSYETLNATQF